MSLLVVSKLTKRVGAVRAVEEVDLAVSRGEIVGLVGPNGSGKTTLFNCVSGAVAPSHGEVWFAGRTITNWPMERVARAGLVRTFQTPLVFDNLTVSENVTIALEVRRSSHHAANGLPRTVDALLEFANMRSVSERRAVELTQGQKRLLGLTLAAATNPVLLMLDEPAAGLNELESGDLANLLRRIHELHVTLFIVEHDMPFLLPLAQRLIVLDAGTKLCEGSVEEVRRDPRVVQVYLGKKYSE